MRRAIQKHSRDFAAVAMIALVAVLVAGYVLAHQRVRLPGWVPVVGQSSYVLKGEVETAKSITPGQGQTVDIAGVPVGLIEDVKVIDGRAVVTMSIDGKYRDRVYRDASMLLRPKTGLEDMVIELTPGHAGSGHAPSGYTIPVKDTAPNVELDQVLAQLDTDTRDYLKLLLGGAGRGLKGKGEELAADFRRLDPLARDTDAVFTELSKRRHNLRRLVHNFQALSTELGSRDDELARLVQSSNRFFGVLASQDDALKASLDALPGTLRTTRSALGKTGELARTLGPTVQALRPGARKLGPALRQAQPFLRDTTPVVRDQLRPFAQAVGPTVRLLRPTADDLAALAPKLVTTFKVANYALNELAYNPPGPDEGYLFWLAWVNHAGASVFATQDAHGPIRRGLLVLSCSTLGLLQQVAKVNTSLETVVGLLDLPDPCPKSAQGGGS